MAHKESPLRAVRTQVQFEVMQATAAVAQATEHAAQVQRQLTDLTLRCEHMVGALSGAVRRSQVNPTMIETLRRLYQAEYHTLREAQSRFAEAHQREQEARSALAALRNRERSLDRALRAEQRQQDQKRQVVQMAIADDLWLQRVPLS